MSLEFHFHFKNGLNLHLPFGIKLINFSSYTTNHISICILHNFSWWATTRWLTKLASAKRRWRRQGSRYNFAFFLLRLLRPRPVRNHKCVKKGEAYIYERYHQLPTWEICVLFYNYISHESASAYLLVHQPIVQNLAEAADAGLITRTIGWWCDRTLATVLTHEWNQTLAVH